MTSQDRGLVSRVGSVEIDWPRSTGYYGGIALAVGMGMIEPPLGLFIAAIPFLKMLDRPNSSFPARTVSQFLDGASKPVGGDSESSIRVLGTGEASRAPSARVGLMARPFSSLKSIWDEAQTLR